MIVTTQRAGRLVAAVAAGAVLALTACAADEEGSAEGEGDVVLRATTAQVENANEHLGFWAFVEELEESAPWITIEYLGGPESIPGVEQAESVASGAVDMASNCACYYSHIVQVADAMALAPTTPLEDRENGALDRQNELHEPHGLYVLGQGMDHYGAQLQLGSRHAELDENAVDFSGWLIRAGGAHTPLVEALGGEAVNLPISDVYNAMDRGTVDGFIAGNFGVEGLGLKEPVEATLDVELVGSVYPVIMNRATWDSLDERTQDALTEAMIAVEGRLESIYAPLIQEQLDDFAADGKVIITPPSAEADRITQIVNDATWDDLLSRAPEAEEFLDIYGLR